MSTPEINRLELALKASNEGIWKWNLLEDKIHYSSLLLEFMGVTNQEQALHLFKDIDKLYHPADTVKLKAKLKAFMKTTGRQTFGADCRYQHPDGSPRWFRIRGASQRDSSGTPTLIAGSVIDITKRKRVELLLAEEKHLLNLLAESIPVNIYFKNKDSKFVMANTATSEKMGLSKAKDIIGKSDHDFFDARHADKSLKDEVTIMESMEKLNGTLEKEIWDGDEETWCITSKYPWLDHNGKIKGTFGVTNDVSDIVKTQTRLVEVAQTYKDRNDIYKEELKLASEVQQAILAKKIPSLPTDLTNKINSKYIADFAVTHIPMHGLAGDFYEAIPISETKMGILLCDVMGHGVRASLIVAMIRGLISKEQESAASPEKFLSCLNHGLCHILFKAGITMFSTAIYCVIDVSAGSLTMACAGHPLPILKRNSHYKLLDAKTIQTGTALGLVSESEYESTTIPLDDLEEVIFYTDGIYEVVNAEEEELGMTKLIDTMNNTRDPKESSIHNLSRIAKEHSHDKQYNDDVCLLSVQIQR
ncbi:MAG: SpoIIE family protein phosphatase [Akkermansiaceae bacterium]